MKQYQEIALEEDYFQPNHQLPSKCPETRNNPISIPAEEEQGSKTKRELLFSIIELTKSTSEAQDEFDASNNKPTLSHQIKNIGTNLFYNIKSLKSKMPSILSKSTKCITQQAEPLYLFSHQYHNFKSKYDARIAPVSDFLKDFVQLIWFSYRKNFPALRQIGSEKHLAPLMSDQGWGCMVRVGQMALAEIFTRHLYSERPVFPPAKGNSAFTLYRPSQCFSLESLKLITSNDKNLPTLQQDPSHHFDSNPFSVHSIATHAALHYDKKVGEWFGAAALTFSLVDLNLQHQPFSDLELVMCTDGLIKPLQVLEGATSECSCQLSEQMKEFQMADDPMKALPLAKSNAYVYIDEYQHEASFLDVRFESQTSDEAPGDLCHNCAQYSRLRSLSQLKVFKNLTGYAKSRAQSRRWSKGVAVFVPLKLGLDGIDEALFTQLKQCMTHKTSVGIMAAQGTEALYVVGFHGKHAIVLDPHYVQESLHNFDEELPSQVKSFHCQSPLTVPFSQLSSSLQLVFYLRSLDDFESWSEFLREQSRSPLNFLSVWPRDFPKYYRLDEN